MTLIVNTKVTVNAIDITTSTLEYSVERPYGDSVATATIKTTSAIYNALTPVVGQTVKIFRKFVAGSLVDPTDLIFKGTITKFNQDGASVDIECKDMLYNAVKLLVNREFLASDPEGGVVSEIFKTIVNTYVGLTATGVSVQNTGTLNILQEFKCNQASCMDRMQALATVVEYQFYYRPDTDLVYFEPYGFNNNNNTLTVGSEIIRIPKWETDPQEMGNDIFVIGASQLTETIEYFSGDGVTTVYTLANSPVSVRVFVDGSINPEVGGLVGVNPNAQYYIDQTLKTITFTAGNIPGVGVNNIEIDYSYNLPTPVHLIDSTSVGLYTTSQKAITLNDVTTVADSQTRGTGILAQNANPRISTVLAIQSFQTLNIQVGQNINIVDNVNNITGTRLINRYVLNFPTDHDDLYVGDKEFRYADYMTEITTAIKRLQEKELMDTSVIYQVIEMDHTLTLSRQQLVVEVDRVNDSFILGDNPYGVLGRGVILDDFESGVAAWSGTNCTVASES